MELRAWTDCTIPELGDAAGRPAPLREAIVVDYDGGERATAVVGGKPVQIDVRFLYVRKGAAEKAPAFDLRPLAALFVGLPQLRLRPHQELPGLNAPNVITKRRVRTP